jgi:hypothetical protein
MTSVLVFISEVKVQVNLSLCLIKHHAMKAYGGVEVYLHAFLTSALESVSGQLYAPADLLSGKESPVTIGYEAGSAPQSVCTRRRREKSLLLSEWNPRSSDP